MIEFLYISKYIYFIDKLHPDIIQRNKYKLSCNLLHCWSLNCFRRLQTETFDTRSEIVQGILLPPRGNESIANLDPARLNWKISNANIPQCSS